MEIGNFDSTRRQYYSLFPYRNPEMSLPNSRWSHTASAHMHESGMSEIVDTGNQQSNKESYLPKSAELKKRMSSPCEACRFNYKNY